MNPSTGYEWTLRVDTYYACQRRTCNQFLQKFTAYYITNSAMLETLIIALGFVQSVWGLQVNLHHRLFVPSNPESAQFIWKGSVDLDYALGTPFTDLNPTNDTDITYTE
jgi:hypothetical protein